MEEAIKIMRSIIELLLSGAVIVEKRWDRIGSPETQQYYSFYISIRTNRQVRRLASLRRKLEE